MIPGAGQRPLPHGVYAHPHRLSGGAGPVQRAVPIGPQAGGPLPGLRPRVVRGGGVLLPHAQERAGQEVKACLCFYFG